MSPIVTCCLRWGICSHTPDNQPHVCTVQGSLAGYILDPSIIAAIKAATLIFLDNFDSF